MGGDMASDTADSSAARTGDRTSPASDEAPEQPRMQAFRRDRYGPPEVLERREIDRPVPGPDEVLVEIHAAGVNPADWHLLRGEPYVMRLQFGLRTPKVVASGLDVAGRVERVGAAVTAFQPDDDVLGTLDFADTRRGNGAFAEYACVPADSLAVSSITLTYEEAASLPIAGLTALQGLRAGGVGAGTSVLINGASGGVGTIAVQLADSMGATVTAVCSARNADLVESLGADHVVDYTREDFTAQGRQYDCVVDWVGNRSLSALRRALLPEGTLVLSGGAGGRWIGPLGTFATAIVLDRVVKQNLHLLSADVNSADLETLVEFVDDGTVRPVIDRTYPIEETPAAVRYVEGGHASGKVVVTVTE